MKSDYEDAYARIEEHHPWFVARRELFPTLVELSKETRILDFGCGTGMFLTHLHRAGFTELCGVEQSAALRERFRTPEIRLFPELGSERYDVVFLLDVLEHVEADEELLADLRSRLEPGGHLVLSVPAHPFLWGPHDEANKHVRRYRRGELRAKLERAGFVLERYSWWNCFAFPLACLVRLLRLGGPSGDLERGPAPVIAFYRGVLRLENRLLRRVGLPFGLSLIAVARPAREAGAAAGRR